MHSGSAITLDTDLINRVKAHILVTFLPNGLKDGEDAQAFREWVLRLWISKAIWDALEREGSQFAIPTNEEPESSRKQEDFLYDVAIKC